MNKITISQAQKEALEKQIAALTVTAVISVTTLGLAQLANVLTEAKNIEVESSES